MPTLKEFASRGACLPPPPPPAAVPPLASLKLICADIHCWTGFLGDSSHPVQPDLYALRLDLGALTVDDVLTVGPHLRRDAALTDIGDVPFNLVASFLADVPAAQLAQIELHSPVSPSHLTFARGKEDSRRVVSCAGDPTGVQKSALCLNSRPATFLLTFFGLRSSLQVFGKPSYLRTSSSFASRTKRGRSPNPETGARSTSCVLSPSSASDTHVKTC